MAVRVKHMTITPKQAEAWLEASQTKNRNERQDHIQLLAAQMKDGAWADNGATLVFDEAGNILDGHHRLRACVRAEVPFTSLVVFDAPPDAMATIDTGVIRSIADALTMTRAEESYSRDMPPAAKLVWLAECGRLDLMDRGNRHVAFSALVCLDVIGRHPGLRQAVVAAQQSYRQFRPVPKSVWSFLHYWLPRFGEERAAEFVGRLADGAGMQPNSAVARLRERLINNSMSNLRMAEVDRFALILKGWRAHCNGQTFAGANHLRWTSVEEFPSPNPDAK
ncbi:MAG: hypothetical protein U0804_28490 [Gemmataceae bacterium]